MIQETKRHSLSIDISETKRLPQLEIEKIGIVSRDYRVKYENGVRDFSYVLPQVLKMLDKEKCDAIILSSYSIIPRPGYDPRSCLVGLNDVRALFLEIKDRSNKEVRSRYMVYYKTPKGWGEYELHQKFSSLKEKKSAELEAFVKNEVPKRILGNTCLILCGESNGIKYSRKRKSANDEFGLRANIPLKTHIILNPVHDIMIRYEMKLKRRFLSEKGRWVISVWNKGKEFNGNARDGKKPAWTVYHDGKEIIVEPIKNQLDVEIGILDTRIG